MNKFSNNSEPSDETRNLVPSSPAELGTRIQQAADSLGTRVYAASVMGVSVDSLARYIRGAEPQFIAVARLCEASGYSLDWMFSGQGERLAKNRYLSCRQDVGEPASAPIVAEEAAEARFRAATSIMQATLRDVESAIAMLGLAWSVEKREEMKAIVFKVALGVGRALPEDQVRELVRVAAI